MLQTFYFQQTTLISVFFMAVQAVQNLMDLETWLQLATIRA